MSLTPCASTSTKRKRTTTTPAPTPAPRKRVKRTLTDQRPKSESKKTRQANQYTLTQIDFVNKDSFGQHDAELETELLEPVTEPAVFQARVKPTPARRALRKRNSTLTQMGFFDTDSPASPYNFDSTPLGFPPRHPVVPAFDGADDDFVERLGPVEPEEQDLIPPPRARSVRSTGSVKKAKASDSQEYRPTHPRKRRKVQSDAPQRDGLRRRPGRAPANSAHPPIRPSMVIRDSTDFVELPVDSAPLKTRALAVPTPKTPSKDRDRIPSSQTPESLKRSTRKANPKRRALAELSTNLQNSPSKLTRTKSELLYDSAKQSPKRSPKRSKICILKLPTKAVRYRGDEHGNKDAQDDIWSLQATSSTGKLSQRSSADHADPQIAASTSAELATLKKPTLPELLAQGMVGYGRTGTIYDKTLLAESVNVIPELGLVEEDGASDFGSPVANDTQFVGMLHQRISSPLPSSKDSAQRRLMASASVQGSRGSPAEKKFEFATIPSSPVLASTLPAPRLVPSPIRAMPRELTSSTIHTLPSVSTPGSRRVSAEKVSITHVPLNDTVSRPQSSSSPLGLPPPISTQRSVYLGSMPHPSQISTQAASTQAYFPISPAIQARQSNEAQAETITIKDSSSVPARFSQFPLHDIDAFAPIELGVNLQNEEELDLDPSTSQLQMMEGDDKDTCQVQAAPTSDDVTQTPSEHSRPYASLERYTTTQSLPVLVGATTRSQRNAQLEVIALRSSSQSPVGQRISESTLRTRKTKGRGSLKRLASTKEDEGNVEDNDLQEEELPLTSGNEPPPSSLVSSIDETTPKRTLRRRYSPIAGFDNDTQSNFTQGGHITAAYIHRGRDEGWLPASYVPKPYKAKAWKGGAANAEGDVSDMEVDSEFEQ